MQSSIVESSRCSVVLPTHWIYRVLIDHDWPLPCFFYDSPFEMFNLPLTTDVSVDPHDALFEGVLLDLIHVKNPGILEKSLALQAVETAVYLSPRFRRKCAFVGLTKYAKDVLARHG